MEPCGLLVESSLGGGRAGKLGRILAFAALFCALPAAAAVAPAAPAAPDQLAELAAKLPLRFEENVGQVKAAEVRYVARGRGYRLFLAPAEAVFSLGSPKSPDVVRLRLAGAAARPVLAGTAPLPTRSNYLQGNDPRAWRTGVASFAGVRYENVYPGTDLVFSGSDRRVEQSFFLAAGAEPGRIRLRYEGAAGVAVGKGGELVLRTPGGELTADRPVAYQVVAGERRPVECRYELLAGKTKTPEVRFALGRYDRGLPLVIDPIFSNSTFLGGTDGDTALGVAVDGSGNVYVAGNTASADFPGTVSPGGVQAGNAGGADGFVAKIDPTGTTLLYSTYLGGSGDDGVIGIAVDSAGNAYLTGSTNSTDFPGVTAGSLQSANGGGLDAFAAKLSPTGAALLYATYLGGAGTDFGQGIAIDGSGNAYVTGPTGSASFPGVTAGSLQPANAGGTSDAFVTKIDATGAAAVYSTYLGGSGADLGYQIAVDASGDAVIVGDTDSSSFPGVTAGSLQSSNAGGQEAFVAKLSPAGTAFLYATYLGGAGSDFGHALALDSSGAAYVAGFTDSSSFPGVTAGSIQPDNPGGFAAFLTKLNAAGGAIVYSTFLGGGSTQAFGVALDPAANAYVTGVASNGYPIANADLLQPEFGGGGLDGFVTKVNAAGDSLVYSTYAGGGRTDVGRAIAVDGARNAVYAAGGSVSDSLPGTAPGSIQPANAGGSQDAFLVRIVPAAVLTIDKTADVGTVDPGNKITYTLTYENVGDLAASGATLTETVPDNTVFKAANSTAGWSCTPSDQAGSACTLALGTVAVGASGTATFTVKVKANVSASGSEITNTACAHPGPNCATVQTPTTAAPILSITKTANFNDAKPGNVLRYTIKVFNTGNQDAPVAVTDTVPGNTTFDPANSTAGWSCSPDNSAGSVCTFPVGVLGTGNHATVVFAATLSTLFSNTACAQVAAASPEFAARTKAIAPPVCSTATTPLK